MRSNNLLRSFVIEKEATQETKIIPANLSVQDGLVDLEGIFSQLGNPYGKVFKIYRFDSQRYEPLFDYCPNWTLPFVYPAELFESEIILLKYETEASSVSDLQQTGKSLSDASSTKKQRSKERTLAQVIDTVKYWRGLHTSHIRGKKLNLQESAEMVGMSKKSLDDYFYQLRLGEKYGFDFKSHLHDKVGVLRNYVKEMKKKKRSTKIEEEKHPRELKILQDHALMLSSPEEQNWANLGSEDLMKQMLEEKGSVRSIEEQFYNDFQFMEQGHIDPFLDFQGSFNKNNNKRSIEDEMF